MKGFGLISVVIVSPSIPVKHAPGRASRAATISAVSLWISLQMYNMKFKKYTEDNILITRNLK